MSNTVLVLRDSKIIFFLRERNKTYMGKIKVILKLCLNDSWNFTMDSVIFDKV